MIKIKDLSFSYGENKIFDGFSLEINDGERVLLRGASGVGKTTLLRLILGLEKAGSGEINTDNGKISVVFQEDRLLPFKTVKENLTLFTDEKTARDCLENLGIIDAAELYPSELSGGMARRVSLARALSRDADIYIFDEAFSGLDSENIEKAAEFINKKTKGKILIAVSHNMDDAKRLAARTVDIGTI